MRLLIEQVTNIRLRPSPQEDIGASGAEATIAQTGAIGMKHRVSTAYRTCVAAALAWTASGALAQLSPAERSALASLGYTAADFRTFEITQIAPSYAPFTTWRTCVRQAAEPTIRQRSPDETQNIVLGLCQDREAEARSIIASRIGLASATRVMALARAVETQRIRNLYASLNSPAPDGLTRIAGWDAYLGREHCTVAYSTEDSFAPGVVIFEIKPGRAIPTMALLLDGDVARAALQPPAQHEIVTTLSSFSGMSGRPLGQFHFKLGSASGKLALIGTPTPAQLEVLKTGTAIQINGGLSRPVTFQTPDIRVAWDALQRCAAALPVVSN